jgi:hypothetical protein
MPLNFSVVQTWPYPSSYPKSVSEISTASIFFYAAHPGSLTLLWLFSASAGGSYASGIKSIVSS